MRKREGGRREERETAWLALIATIIATIMFEQISL